MEVIVNIDCTFYNTHHIKLITEREGNMKNFRLKAENLEIIKIIAGFCVAFAIMIIYNLPSYAFIRPNNKSETEPNNTKESAQLTQPTNEVAERFAADDWSGRYSVAGTATLLDDDWYKVNLPAGEQYLSVVHSYGNHATYVELLDSEDNVIIPKKYGTRYNITKFTSNGGTYYIHITGALDNESQYTLFVGTPMLTSDQVYIRFDPIKTSGTIKKSFSLIGEDILPEQALVSHITLRDLPALGYNGATVENSSSSSSVSFDGTPLSGSIGSLGMTLKSNWYIEFYPKKTVSSIPIVQFFYFYPVYDNTVYPPFSTIKR